MLKITLLNLNLLELEEMDLLEQLLTLTTWHLIQVTLSSSHGLTEIAILTKSAFLTELKLEF